MKTKFTTWNPINPLAGDPINRPGGETRICGKTLSEIQELVEKEKESKKKTNQTQLDADQIESLLTIQSAFSFIEKRKQFIERIKKLRNKSHQVAVIEALELLSEIIDQKESTDDLSYIVQFLKEKVPNRIPEPPVEAKEKGLLNKVMDTIFSVKASTIKIEDPIKQEQSYSLNKKESSSCAWDGCERITKRSSSFCKRHKKINSRINSNA